MGKGCAHSTKTHCVSDVLPALHGFIRFVLTRSLLNEPRSRFTREDTEERLSDVGSPYQVAQPYSAQREARVRQHHLVTSRASWGSDKIQMRTRFAHWKGPRAQAGSR